MKKEIKNKLNSKVIKSKILVQKKKIFFNKNIKKNINKKKVFIKKKIFRNDKVNSNLSFSKLPKKKNFFIKKKNSPSIKYKNLKKKKFSIHQRNNKNFLKKKLIKKNKINLLNQKFVKPLKNFNKKVKIISNMTVFDLSKKMGIKISHLINTMSKQKIILEKNQILSRDLSYLIAEEMGFKVILKKKLSLEDEIKFKKNNKKNKYFLRPPIVTVMGHVDHGKTSLLDNIRKTQILKSEFGGITQSIGAYHVTLKNKKITFLDTPGHAAFKSMRFRGALLTDIIILVIAADDGVMPQTIEAIKHAQIVKVPIIVVINKIDKVNSNFEKIYNELMKYNIVSEKLGGDNIFVHISVKLNQGILELLDAILLQSEFLNLKTRNSGGAVGVVIESFLDRGKGPLISVLLKKGNLKKGDIILCGLEYGKVKSIINEFDEEIKKITPSIPVKILGLSGLPSAGETLLEVRNEKIAKKVSLYRKEKIRSKKMLKNKKINFEKMFKEFNSPINKNILNIFLKSNSKGSLEALINSILFLSNEFKNFKINIIASGVGLFTETDVNLADSCHAILIGFNIQCDSSAKKIIESENLEFRHYSIIYNVIKELKEIILGKLTPKYFKKINSLAVVKNVFKLPKFGVIAGCIITEGTFQKKNNIKILRKNKIIHKGKIFSLKRFKNDVKLVNHGQECGIVIKNYNDIHVNDIIQSYSTKKN
ncbi:translation initiation factor IF-2 [Buchnera aphidicola]|uniref:translation initiation factor IF-2 n=1 Tax=Buchnera aphidicola TaxID=9 RepID=UPI0030ECDA44